MPIPGDVPYYRLCADEYLYTAAPVFGAVATIEEPQSLYRLHGGNVYSARSFEEKLQLELEGHAQQSAALSHLFARHGITVDVASWRHHSWFHRLEEARAQILGLVGANETFVFVDDGTWGPRAEIFGERRAVHMVERNGLDWGAPGNDAEAVRAIEHWRADGAKFIVFAWPAFWWLDYYRSLRANLESCSKSVVSDDRLIVFDLTTEANAPRMRGDRTESRV
jgi:hypothetical protein